jgi:hypothetical protein
MYFSPSPILYAVIYIYTWLSSLEFEYCLNTQVFATLFTYVSTLVVKYSFKLLCFSSVVSDDAEKCSIYIDF